MSGIALPLAFFDSPAGQAVHCDGIGNRCDRPDSVRGLRWNRCRGGAGRACLSFCSWCFPRLPPSPGRRAKKASCSRCSISCSSAESGSCLAPVPVPALLHLRRRHQGRGRERPDAGDAAVDHPGPLDRQCFLGRGNRRPHGASPCSANRSAAAILSWASSSASSDRWRSCSSSWGFSSWPACRTRYSTTPGKRPQPEPNSQQCLQEVERIAPGLVLAFLETTVMVSISVAISTRLGMLPNLVICLSIYVLGHLVPMLAKSAMGQMAIVTFIADLLAAILPVLDHFNIYGPIATGEKRAAGLSRPGRAVLPGLQFAGDAGCAADVRRSGPGVRGESTDRPIASADLQPLIPPCVPARARSADKEPPRAVAGCDAGPRRVGNAGQDLLGHGQGVAAGLAGHPGLPGGKNAVDKVLQVPGPGRRRPQTSVARRGRCSSARCVLIMLHLLGREPIGLELPAEQSFAGLARASWSAPPKSMFA